MIFGKTIDSFDLSLIQGIIPAHYFNDNTLIGIIKQEVATILDLFVRYVYMSISEINLVKM